MKTANIVWAAALSISLSGCANSPSDDDVKQAILSMTGDCRYFTITHLLKVKWALPGSGDYQIDVQYSIDAAPLPDAKDAADALRPALAALNTRIAAATSESDKEFNIHADFLDKIERAQKAGDDATARSLERQRAAFRTQKLEPALQATRDLQAKKIDLIKQGTQRLRDEFFQACPKTPSAVYERIYDNSNIAQYTGMHTTDFATSMRMVKTEEGWRIKG